MALDPQTARAEENLMLSHSVPCQRHASGNNLLAKVSDQGHHYVQGLTHHHAIKDDTIAIKCDCQYAM